MKMTADQFATVVRGLPLTTGQAAAVEELFAAPPSRELPRELIRREVLTEYQAKLILAGRADELTVGRYAILDELGEGGMGQVFKARDTAMDRVVALKLIRDDRLGSPAAIKRFEQEVRAAARLAHPNIVRAYDAGSINGRHFLVTELVAGHDLGRELSRRGALPPGEACEYARQTAVGLQHAFEQGLTHRDIKPSNLLFSTAEKMVKVADFGLARVGGSGAGGLTADGAVMGTPDYISPEQASSANAADIRSDLYSLGCTLYQFLTGHVPFPADNALGKLVAHASQEPFPIEDACPGINPALATVVRRLMAKNPFGRYQTPLEAAEALIPFCPKPRTSTTSLPRTTTPNSAPPPLPPSTLSGESRKTAPVIPPPLPPRAEPLSLDTDEPQPQPQRAPNPPRAPEPGRGNGLILVGAGLGGLALIALILVLVLNRKPDAPITQQTTVNVPVNVTVKTDDWPKAREPGVVIYLVGRGVVTPEELAKPMSLTPGTHTFIAKKDGKDIEARAFDVPAEADKVVATRVVALPDPEGAAEEVRRWGAGGVVTDLGFFPDGNRFFSTQTHGGTQFQGQDNSQRGISGTVTLYSCNSSEVVRRWAVAGVFRVAPVHGTEILIDFPSGLSVTNSDEGTYRRQTNIAEPNMALPQLPSTLAKAEGWWKQRIHLLRVSSDGRRMIWSDTNEAEPATAERVPRGEIVLSTLSKAASGWLDVSEINRIPGDVACFDPSGRRVLVAKSKALTLWDEETGKPLTPSYPGPTADVLSVAVAQDGKRLAAADKDGSVYVWNTGTKEPVATGKGHKGRVYALDFTLDGKRLVSAGEDGTVRVWDAATGKEVAQFKHEGPVYALAMSPGGKRALTGGADKTIRLWQLP